jgi:hypothetical protein
LSFSVRRGPRAETLRPIIKRFGDEIGQCVKLVAESWAIASVAFNTST